MFRVYYKNNSTFQPVDEFNPEQYTMVGFFTYEELEHHGEIFGKFQAFSLIFLLFNRGSGGFIFPDWLAIRSLSVGDVIGYGADARNQKLYAVEPIGFKEIKQK